MKIKELIETNVIQFPTAKTQYRAVIREIGSNDKIMGRLFVELPEPGISFDQFKNQIENEYNDDYAITFEKKIPGYGWKYVTGWNATDNALPSME